VIQADEELTSSSFAVSTTISLRQKVRRGQSSLQVGQRIRFDAISGHWENGASMPDWLSSPKITFEVIQVTRKGSD
jgi:hypothetical protein